MSLGTLAGVLFGFGLFFASIFMSTDNYMAFLSLSSTLMVFGGTLAASYISYQPRYVWLAIKAIGQMFQKPKMSRELLNREIKRIIVWSKLIQSKGLLAMEDEAKKTREPLTRFGATLVSSGYKPEDVREMMETAMETQFERSTIQVDILKTMASTSPAFGMIGTLVGLVVMLQSLGNDISSLGTGLAVALLTTLYGVLFARLVFLPAALKLQQKEEINHFRNQLVVEGISLLAEKQRPRFIQDKLNSYLDPAIHFNIDKQLK